MIRQPAGRRHCLPVPRPHRQWVAPSRNGLQQRAAEQGQTDPACNGFLRPGPWLLHRITALGHIEVRLYRTARGKVQAEVVDVTEQRYYVHAQEPFRCEVEVTLAIVLKGVLFAYCLCRTDVRISLPTLPAKCTFGIVGKARNAFRQFEPWLSC